MRTITRGQTNNTQFPSYNHYLLLLTGNDTEPMDFKLCRLFLPK